MHIITAAADETKKVDAKGPADLSASHGQASRSCGRYLEQCRDNAKSCSIRLLRVPPEKFKIPFVTCYLSDTRSLKCINTYR